MLPTANSNMDYVKDTIIHTYSVHAYVLLTLTATGLPAMNLITDVVLVAANAATDVTLNPVAKYV